MANFRRDDIEPQFAEFPQPAAHPNDEARIGGKSAEDQAHFHGSPEPLSARRASVRIYRPARSAMQSGRANTKEWVLEMEPGSADSVEPLMGWIASDDTLKQVSLHFPTREAAVAFAEKEGWPYQVFEPKEAEARRPKSYADNFPWFGEQPSVRSSLPGGMPGTRDGG